ncbi:MAG: sulfite exporter TauE/SafE family protein [Lewinellaceae bacterium]|nr:sulfite exporter TauE/SafE family protein [Saprospiraceae bacterium]MCB9330429.1 sulfite exporter TauE/SafE family protein [Lewinellaceae bacterium]
MEIELVLLFFGVALLYATAGFGGGSSYLAIMALFGLSMLTLRPVALLCNIVVVSGNLWIFWQNGHLNLKKTAPLALAGIPMAFAGGYWRLSEQTFFILLGISLIAAAFAMWIQSRPLSQQSNQTKTLPVAANLSIGGSLGLLAGLTGIGGGIFLSPVLHLIRWDKPKVIAAAASFFIFCQSIAGISGQLAQGAKIEWNLVFPLLIAVWLGGQIGVRATASRFSQVLVRNLTALLVLYAGFNILWRYL